MWEEAEQLPQFIYYKFNMVTPVKTHRRQMKTASMIRQEGEIVVWTIIRVASKLFGRQAPYPVAVVKMKNGKRAIGQLVDWKQEDLKEGRKVAAVLRRAYVEDGEGVINYAIKFRPV
jgi:hypothetical protein